MNWNNPLPLRAKLLEPVEAGNYIGFLGTAFIAWQIIRTDQEKIFLLVLTLLACGMNYFIFNRLLPDNIAQRRLLILSSGGSLLIIGGYFYLLHPYTIHLEVLFIALIAVVGILAGNRLAFVTTGFVALLYMFINVLMSYSTTGVQVILETLFIVLAGYWTSSLAGLSHEWLSYSSRQNRYVSLLLTIGRLASQHDALGQIIPQIAQAITVELPVTTCKILLLNPDTQSLTLFGSSPLRSVERWQGESGESLKLNDYPPIQQALQTNRYQIFSDLNHLNPADTGLVSTLAFADAKTLGLFPLIAKGKTLGLITVGENRAWGREPFSKEKIDLLQALAIQIAAEIDNARLFRAARTQAQRLEVLNEVGKAIGSTIELDDLLDLIYHQLSKVIPTDTYYLALYDEEQQTLDFHILIDNGKKFPPERIPLTQGLSS